MQQEQQMVGVGRRQTFGRKLWPAGLLACVLLGCGDDESSEGRDSGSEPDGSTPGAHDANSPTNSDPTAVMVPAGAENLADLADSLGRLRVIPKAIALQGDKLIVAGQGRSDLFAARLTRDGVLDDSFGTEGVVTLDGGGTAHSSPLLAQDTDGAYAVVARDDAIWLAGFGRAPSTTTAHTFAVAKLSADGVADASYGPMGVRIVDPAPDSLNNPARCNALYVDSTQRAHCVGQLFQGNQTNDLVVARFTAEGPIDATYPPGGTGAFLNRGGEELGLFAMSSPEGLLVGGDGEIARLTPEGELDTSFGDAGWLVVDALTAQAAVRRSDGKLLVAGFANSTESDERVRLHLTQANEDGTLDTGFGEAGVLDHDFDLTAFELPDGTRVSGGFTFVRGIAELADGGVLLYASIIGVINNYPVLLRLDAEGRPVATFGEAGLWVAQASLPLLEDLSGMEPPSHLAVADGRFYVADLRVDDDGQYFSLWQGAL